MGSMAFWYEKNVDAENVKLDAVMNFNLWTQCSTNDDSFLDILPRKTVSISGLGYGFLILSSPIQS